MYSKGQATGFHVGHFPKGHMPTDYSKWFSSETSFSVNYSEGYEPYVLAARKLLPRYDERFRGYGMNKISFFFHLNALNFSFVVLPHFFVTAVEHKPSESYEKTFGKQSSVERVNRLKALYRLFCSEIKMLVVGK